MTFGARNAFESLPFHSAVVNNRTWMSSPTAQLDPTREFRAAEPSFDLNRYFEISLYLLAAISFVSLAASGGLNLLIVILAGAVFAVRALQLLRGEAVLLQEQWATFAALGYFAFFLFDYSVISRSFLPPVVHLVLFATLIRLFTLRRDRDRVTLAALSFLMILASAIITVDSLFLLCFSAFLLIAVVTFILMEMRYSQRASTLAVTARTAGAERLPSLMARLGPALMLLILLIGAGIFFVLPRRSAGYLGGYSFGNDLSTGFSNKVALGQIGRIQQSDAVAMHIQIAGDSDGGHELYWRGVSLTQFDGAVWFNPYRAFGGPVGPSLGDAFDIPSRGSGRVAGLSSPRLVRYRVLLEPIGTNVFFGASWMQKIRGPYHRIFVSDDGDVDDVDIENQIGRYDVESDISAPSVADLRRAPALTPDPRWQRYLQLPALDPRIAALAASVTASASNPYDKAAQLERHLKTHYGYTLQLPSQPSKDPVADFLFERKQGHCEYFASSMAVMLRSLGIPSRVVNGFHGGEFNRITGEYIVRARDAHSWVEAYFPGEGWITFDPTPSGAGGTSLGRIALYLDALSSFWRDWIVSYDKSQQLTLGKAAIQAGRDRWEAVRRWGKLRYRSMLMRAEQFQRGLSASGNESPVRVHAPNLIKVFAAVFFLMLAVFAVLAWVRSPRRMASTDPPAAASLWYAKMTASLARRGYRRTPAQTAIDFAEVIPEGRLRDTVSEFTREYLEARFGSSSNAAQRLPGLFRSIRNATQA